MIEVEVQTPGGSYPVMVGAGARHRLGEVIPQGVKRAAVVTQDGIGVHCDPGVPHEVIAIDGGEEAKSLETVEELCRSFVDMGLTRNDCVVAVGGGLVTDLAGFAAAVYHRGTSVIHVPTTLLGQVDAAIGGKTGANLPEGKNLVGAFWQPSAVLCDTSVLESLPAREYRSGTGEMAKYHFLGDQLDLPCHDLLDKPLDERVGHCVAIKAKVVSADEREGGVRAILNYGHTLAHALELAGRFDIRHGEAVSVGIHFAALLARNLGRIDDSRVKEHLEVLAAYELPTALPAGSVAHELIALMRRDKKATAGLTFVLDGTRGVELVTGVEEAAVRSTLEEMAS